MLCCVHAAAVCIVPFILLDYGCQSSLLSSGSERESLNNSHTNLLHLQCGFKRYNLGV